MAGELGGPGWPTFFLSEVSGWQVISRATLDEWQWKGRAGWQVSWRARQTGWLAGEWKGQAGWQVIGRAWLWAGYG